MSRRFYETAGRIIISKAGYDAAPGLSDENKIFDSNWSFGASVIQAGSFAFAGWPISINFPQQPYVPAAEVWAEVETEFYDQRGTMHLGFSAKFDVMPGSKIYNNRIEVLNQGFVTPRRVFYTVYGLSI